MLTRMVRTVSGRENSEKKRGVGVGRRETRQEGRRGSERQLKMVTMDSKGPGHWDVAGHCKDFRLYSL